MSVFDKIICLSHDSGRVLSFHIFILPKILFCFMKYDIYCKYLDSLRRLDTLGRFSIIFNKGDNFFDFLIAFLHNKSLGKGSTLKGKNLLPKGANSFLLE